MESQEQNSEKDSRAEELLEQTEKELGAARDRISKLESERAKSSVDTKRLQKKMLEAESKYHIVAKNLKQSVEDNRLLQENIDKVLKEAEEWHKKHKASSALAEKLQSEKSSLEGSLEDSLKDLKKESVEKDKMIMEKQKEILNLQHQLHDQEENARVSEAQYTSCKRHLDSLDLELKSKEKCIGNLEEALNAAKAEKEKQQMALEYEKTVVEEGKIRIEQLGEQLQGEKKTMADLLAEKTKENSNLDVLSERVSGLEHIIEENAKREEHTLDLHTKQIKQKELEIQRGVAAQHELKKKIVAAEKRHLSELSDFSKHLDKLSSSVDGIKFKELEALESNLDLSAITDSCLMHECELTQLNESLDKHFEDMQSWSDGICLKLQRAQVSSLNQSKEGDQRDAIILELQEMVRKSQSERDEDTAALKGKNVKLAEELAALKEELEASLSQQHQVVSDMNNMMEAERFTSKERISSLQRTIEDLEKQFTAEKVASIALLEKEIQDYKKLHGEATQKSSQLKSALDDANYKFLDLNNQYSRVSKQVVNISEDLTKYSEHLYELDLVSKDDIEELGSDQQKLGASPPASPVNLVSQVFALRTKFLKMTQLNQDVASKCKALQLSSGA